jgi:hypothetical protein
MQTQKKFMNSFFGFRGGGWFDSRVAGREKKLHTDFEWI